MMKVRVSLATVTMISSALRVSSDGFDYVSVRNYQKRLESVGVWQVLTVDNNMDIVGKNESEIFGCLNNVDYIMAHGQLNEAKNFVSAF